MTSYNIIPEFDTSGGLPADLDVYYSTDQSTWLASNEADYVYVTPDLTQATTYFAQIRYSPSSPVLDENGAELPVRSILLDPSVGSLSPGSSAPDSWAAFSIGADGDGLGLDTTGDTSDSLIGAAAPAARFVTPMYNDNADLTEVALITHPTSYYKSDGTRQADPTVYIYCNGNRVQATKSTVGYGGQAVWKAPVKDLTGQCEFRAIVVPEKGTPTILQGGWNWTGVYYAIDTSSRSCMSNDYTTVQVGPGQTFATLSGAFAAQTSGDGAVRYVCSGQGTAWADAFSTHDVAVPGLAQDIANNPLYTQMPIVDGAELKIKHSPNTQIRGILYKNCNIYNWPNPDTTAANRNEVNQLEWWSRGSTASVNFRNNNHSCYVQTENCNVQIKENRTYSVIDGNAQAQTHVTRGFGTLMQLYDIGQYGNRVGFNLLNPSGKKLEAAHFGSTFRFMGSNCAEAVNCTSHAPSSDNDIYNANLCVNSHAYGLSKFMYPFGSVLSDDSQMDYNYDYTRTTTDATNTQAVVSNAVVQQQALLNYTTDPDVPGNPAPYAQVAINDGIWPDVLPINWKASNQAVDISLVFSDGDGTFTDQYGYEYTSWDKEWTRAQDAHVDFIQQFSASPDYLIVAGCEIGGVQGGNQDYQGIFFRSTTVEEAAAVWDCQFTTSAQVPFSFGFENGTTPGPQIYGPDIEILGGTTAVRDYITSSNQNVQVVQNDGVTYPIVDYFGDLGITDSGFILSTGTTSRGGTATIVTHSLGRSMPTTPTFTATAEYAAPVSDFYRTNWSMASDGAYFLTGTEGADPTIWGGSNFPGGGARLNVDTANWPLVIGQSQIRITIEANGVSNTPVTATYNGAQGTNNIRRFDYDAGGPIAPAGIAEGDEATITIEVIAD